MNEVERYKLQKKGMKTSYEFSINNKILDNYIISRLNIRNNIEQEQDERDIKKIIDKEIKDIFTTLK